LTRPWEWAYQRLAMYATAYLDGYQGQVKLFVLAVFNSRITAGLGRIPYRGDCENGRVAPKGRRPEQQAVAFRLEVAADLRGTSTA
jgi:hypothetical protein